MAGTVIKEGWLTKAPFHGRMGQKKRRYFVLESNQLSYYESQDTYRSNQALGRLPLGRS
jgi:hypothetical protein